MKTYLVSIYLDGTCVEYNAEVTGSNKEQAQKAIAELIPLDFIAATANGNKLSIEITEKP